MKHFLWYLYTQTRLLSVPEENTRSSNRIRLQSIVDQISNSEHHCKQKWRWLEHVTSEVTQYILLAKCLEMVQMVTTVYDQDETSLRMINIKFVETLESIYLFSLIGIYLKRWSLLCNTIYAYRLLDHHCILHFLTLRSKWPKWQNFFRNEHRTTFNPVIHPFSKYVNWIKCILIHLKDIFKKKHSLNKRKRNTLHKR